MSFASEYSDLYYSQPLEGIIKGENIVRFIKC